MIQLHGVTISNYYNTAKLALLEKDVPFTDNQVFPSQEPAVLAQSPMGKVPWLDIDGTRLSETNVIFDYLEDIKPEPALYPADPLARAKVKELVRVVELYLDAPARRHIQTTYFGAPVDERVREEAKPAIENGLRALHQLAKFAPYLAGDEYTFADIAAYFQLGFTNLTTKQIYDWDIIETDPKLKAYIATLEQRPLLAETGATMRAALEKFFAHAK